jgi:hypothetical protein
MKQSKDLCRIVLAASFLTPWIVHADTRSDVLNGAVCIPYPPYQDAIPYQFWLYGFNNSAYCHLTMPDEWSVNDLSYVLFTGSVSGDLLRARLCVHNGHSLAVTCGAERTISSSGSVNWVARPVPLPPSAVGAYVVFRFPAGRISTVRSLIPVWSN